MGLQSVANLDLKDKSLPQIIEEHEKVLRFSHFNADVAFDVGSLIRKKFLESYTANDVGVKGVVVHIELFSGMRLFSAAAGEAPAVGPDNWLWVQAKTNVVKRFSKSTYRVGREIVINKGSTPEEKGLVFPDYVGHGGGFPIWLENNPIGPIGAIVVSGLPQHLDHQLIVDALSEYLHV